MRSGVPGVATGLAWTPVGGDILFIEAARMPGNGQADPHRPAGRGDEGSAQAALSLVKARSDRLGIAPEALEKTDIHVHVPAGATPKDGPSAGVAMFLALASLLTGRPVRSDVAMTGEIRLRGLVLPIGGVKEKVLAALRAGIRHVMLPKRNEQRPRGHPGRCARAARLHLARGRGPGHGHGPRAARPREGRLALDRKGVGLLFPGKSNPAPSRPRGNVI